jgi:hypothetical protein
MKMGEHIVKHTTDKQSLFRPDELCSKTPEELSVADHTNCMRFAQNLMNTFEVPMDTEFLRKHGKVLHDALLKMQKNPDLEIDVN